MNTKSCDGHGLSRGHSLQLLQRSTDIPLKIVSNWTKSDSVKTWKGLKYCYDLREL